MKRFDLLIMIALLISSAAAAWPQLRNSQPAPSLIPHSNEIGSGNFNPFDLLDRNTPKSDIYLHARAELQTIGRRSSCHQVVLKVYMKHCQLLEEVEAQPGERLQDYIDSFAASLAICDLRAADAHITDLCELFQEPALQIIFTTSHARGLHASREQIGNCLKGLYSDQNSWVSINGNKETATSLCRTAKDDIAREQFLSKLYAMTNMLEEMKFEEEQRRKDRIEDQLSTKKYLQTLRDQTSDIMNGVVNIWDKSVRAGQTLTEALQNASVNVQAAEEAVMRILKSLMESNAEHAFAQQNAVVATYDLTIASQNASNEIGQLIAEIRLRMAAMDDAQSAREHRYAEAVDKQLNRVQNHTEEIVEALYQAKNIASEMKDSVEDAVNNLSNWAVGTGPTGPWGISWPLLIICPLLTILVIGYGIPASYTRNIGLLILGIFIAKLLSMAMNVEWQTEVPSPFAYRINRLPIDFNPGNSTVATMSN